MCGELRGRERRGGGEGGLEKIEEEVADGGGGLRGKKGDEIGKGGVREVEGEEEAVKKGVWVVGFGVSMDGSCGCRHCTWCWEGGEEEGWG